MNRLESDSVKRMRLWWRRLGTAVFGDRVGSTLFVGACLFFGLLWQVGFFLNDTWTIANTLVGVADGHLYIDRVVYGSYLQTPGKSPGTHVVGQRVYGRNYAQIFIALPFLWGMRFLGLLADPRILLAALWSLGIVLFGHQLGGLLDRYREALLSACLLALGLFGLNVWLALPLEPHWIPHLSLQLSTIVVAGLVVVFLHRLLGLVADPRTATTLAAAAAVSTPLAFWATLPKRHTLSALFVLLTVYSFARSRSTDDAERGLQFRALAYGWVGLLAWLHAANGLTAFISLAVVDLATARSNRVRDLAIVGVVFAVSMLPFMLTNMTVTGNPMLPPRLWPRFAGSEPVFIDGEAFNGAESTASPSAPESDTGQGQSIGFSGLIRFASSAWLESIGGIQYLWNKFDQSLTLFTTNPSKFSQAFIRGGWAPYQTQDKQAINLTFLESAPWFGAVVALPAFARRIAPRWPRDWKFERQIDLLVVAIVFGTLLFNLQRIPIHASVTVRYLHSLVPLAVYTVARLPPIRTALDGGFRAVIWSFSTGLLIGGQLMIVGLALLPSTYGGAIQLHAMVNLAFASILAVWCLVAAINIDYHWFWTAGAALIGLTLAAATISMVFLITNHLTYGDPVLGFGQSFRIVIPP